MDYIRLGGTDMHVSRLVLGCWAAGGGKEWGQKLDDDMYLDMIAAALAGGVNFFDTASGYGDGHSEFLLKTALSSLRHTVYLSTKASAKYLVRGLARKTVERNLQRLGTDYIDLYFIHWPHPDIPVEENMEELLKLKEEGVIKAIGVSNFTAAHLRRALLAGPVDVVQPCYSLFWRQMEKELLPLCRERELAVITYSSIAQGLLTAKFTKDWQFDPDDQRPQVVPLFQGRTFAAAIDAARSIEHVGQRYGKSASQTAINWVLQQPGITAAIVGAKTRAQMAENLGAVGWALSEADRQQIGDFGMQVASLVAEWDTMYARRDDRLRMNS
jgi:aryl-alcohol dehydrogenase-like predicted oxidoreductase